MDALQHYFKNLKASRTDREKALNYVNEHPENQVILAELAFHSKAQRVHIYAAWVWELFILEDIDRLHSYLHQCISKLPSITNSSKRRSISKIFWYYFRVKSNREALNENEKQKLIEAFLDWVITEDKTAPLSFSIKVLALFQDEAPELSVQLKELLIHSNRTYPKGLNPVLRDVFKN
ncbi:hypothetical protein N9R82_02710 [Flavobacteriaceae bacterium]|jgi:hypothetical protein|nr:hypothetical protein [Flavobacteriaceae bacterium]MDA9851496.1 hypothetical protein [Flavobacteriaceae bacterium]